MGLAAGIIIIFIIMVAFFISFGKAFKIKNQIINYIEQQEGIDKTQLDNLKSKYTTNDFNVCYTKIKRGSDLVGFTMSVEVMMKMDETILGGPFRVEIPIKGETRIIEKGNTFTLLSDGYPITGINICS